MKAPLALFLAATVAACAAAPESQVVAANCKVEPVVAANTVNKRAQPSELDRKWADAQLRSSGYYRHSSERDQNAAVVQASRDCP
jgi:hypothetical protein